MLIERRAFREGVRHPSAILGAQKPERACLGCEKCSGTCETLIEIVTLPEILALGAHRDAQERGASQEGSRQKASAR